MAEKDEGTQEGTTETETQNTETQTTQAEEPKLTPDEERAIALGWKPQDQWEGDKGDWVPAKFWLRYGDLEQQLIVSREENKHKEKVLKSMQGHYVRVKEDSVKEVRDIIRRQKNEALKNQDYERVAELDAEAHVLEEGMKQKHNAVDQEVIRDIQETPGPSPEFIAWNRMNPWYQAGSNDPLTQEADALAIGFTRKFPGAAPSAVLQYVEDRIKRTFPEQFRPATKAPAASPVDDGGGEARTTTSRSSKSSYTLSPAEKEAAARFGMSEKEYAEEVVKYDRRKGNK